eukprot:Colp12_sorted_trinity150504_noHs@18527
MLIPKKNRNAIYEYIFNEGVLVAEKDFNAPKHMVLEIPNLEVIKACQSLKSRGYVNEKFAWRHYYWYLTNEGIEYLRQYLHIPAEIVPATMKKVTRPTNVARPLREERPRYGGEGGDRGEYRRNAGEKKTGAEANFNPEFRGGYAGGRGGFSGERRGGFGRGGPRDA